MQLAAGYKKEGINSFLLATGYGLFFYCFYCFLVKSGFATTYPDNKSLNQWDAGVYLNIAKNGYTYLDPHDNNTGCFILFPLIWRWLHIGVAAMSAVNYLFFAAGFSILAGIYKISTSEKLLWLAVPTVYIMCIPYTEALFFLLMSVLFYGIIKKKRWLIWLSLFLAALTRATGIFLLPALLIMELVANHKKTWYLVVYYYLIDYAIPIVAGLAVFILYQYHAVGIWFAYFIQQQKYEGHIFNWPVLPFSSMEGLRNLWISALAIFCCFISSVAILMSIFKWLFRDIPEPDKLLVLSFVFLGITLYKTIFYNPTWVTGTTLTIGINRYVFATPFFYIFLHHFTSREVTYKPQHYIYAFILCNIVWLFCGSYMHIQFILYFNFGTLLVFLYLLYSNKKLTWPGFAIMGISMLFQVIMFQQYLNGLYPD